MPDPHRKKPSIARRQDRVPPPRDTLRSTPNPRLRVAAASYGHKVGGIPTALVLSGGGAKGSFEVGALAYLTRKEIWDTINLRFICGTSVGAINALKITESGRDGIKDLVSLYVSLQSEEDMFTPQPWLTKVKKIAKNQFAIDIDLGDYSAEKTRAKVTSDILLGMDKTSYTVLCVLTLGGIGIGIASVNEAKKKFEKLAEIAELVLGASSLFTLAPIEKTIRENINFRVFGPKLSEYVKMRLAVVSLEEGTTWYVTEQATLIKGNAKEPTDSWALSQRNGMGSIKEALVNGTMASAAIPCIFETKHLRADPSRDAHFVDGGVRDVLPVRAALELGAKRVIAVLASPPELKAEAVGSYHRAKMATIGSRSLDILTTEIKANELNPEYGRWPSDVERFLIYPEMLIHGTQEVNPGLIGINMCYGYMRAYELTLKRMVGKDLGVRFAALWANTLAITDVRKRIWTIEHNRDGGGPLLELKPDWEGPLVWNERTSRVPPTPPDRVIVFRKNMLAFLRNQKKKLLKLVEERMRLLEYDAHSLPLKFEGPSEIPFLPLKPTDWWSKWERHGVKPIFPERTRQVVKLRHVTRDGSITESQVEIRVPAAEIQFDSFYFRWGLWSARLPIGFDGTNYVYEQSIPAAPTPTPALLHALD